MQQAISAFLLTALLVTGGITAVVFIAPSLVSIGLVFFILPGLILSLTPTVFVYLSAFSIPWFLLQRHGMLAGAMGGMAAVGWLAYGLPTLLNRVTDRRLAEALSQEKAPTTKVGPVRVLALQSSAARSNMDCGDLCQLLLYNGTVERIVLFPGKAIGTQFRQYTSFHVERLPSCPTLPKSRFTGTPWLDHVDSTPVAQAARLRMAGGECLVQDDTWTGTPDLLLERFKTSFGTPAGYLQPVPGEVRAEGLQLIANGETIARLSKLHPRHLKLPLVLQPRGGAELRMYGWEWSRTAAPTERVDTRPFLRQFTDFDLTLPRGLDSSSLRDRLDEALNNPATPADDSVFGLVKDYYADLRERSAADADVQRLARLIADPRVTSFDFPAHRLADDQLLALKDPILDRLLALTEQVQQEPYRNLASRLRFLPDGAFNRPDPRVEQLLATPELRAATEQLIIRLADRGPAEVPRLVDFVRDGFVKRPNRRHIRTAAQSQAALRGLCRLGRDAAPALGSLRQLAAAGEIPQSTLDSDLWRATLISLGAPVAEFDLPKNHTGSVHLYRQRLSRLAGDRCERI